MSSRWEIAAWPKNVWPGVALCVAVAAMLPFVGVLGAGWVNWDDPGNFLENYNFRGIGATQLIWAFTTQHYAVYQPFAWLAFSLQYWVWQLNPVGYHAVSLGLHGLIAWLICRLTNQLLGAPAEVGRARAIAIATILFMVSPLRVEAVAWASCQPYLWCIACALSSASCYLKAQAESSPARRIWVLVLCWLLFVAALMFKAIALSLPAVFLILDWYPLRRLGRARYAPFLEKLPFVAVSVFFSVVASQVRSAHGALVSLSVHGLGHRLFGALYAVGFYLWKTIYPLRLSILNPLPDDAAFTDPAVLGLIVLAVVFGASLVIAGWTGRRAWLAFGLTYLVMLAPHLGLVQAGLMIVTDRYAYMPTIGLVSLLVSGTQSLRLRSGACGYRRFGGVLAGGFIIVNAGLSWKQTRTWHDSLALWQQAFAQVSPAVQADRTAVGVGHYLFADALLGAGRDAEAVDHLRQSLRVEQRFNLARLSLASLLVRAGRDEEALGVLRGRRVNMDGVLGDVVPRAGVGDEAAALAELAMAEIHRGGRDEAIRLLELSVKANPANARARSNLGFLLADAGIPEKGLPHLSAAVQLAPSDAPIRNLLGAAYIKLGRMPEAEAAFRTAVDLAPGFQSAWNHLGFALLSQARPTDALAALDEAVRLDAHEVETRINRSEALHRLGRDDSALQDLEAALAQQPANSRALSLLATLRRPRLKE